MNATMMWIIYDGRAEHGDEDDAAILEACTSRRDLKEALYSWRQHDGVLFEYETQGNALAVNGRKIGHLREGRKALLTKCTSQQHCDGQNGEGSP